MRAVIAAAGTAGHINPAISIANTIVEKENIDKSDILFIGTDYGLENDLVAREGYELKHLNAYGLKKKLNFESFKRAIITFSSAFKAKKILKKFKPDVVIATGGYIAIPVIIAARMLKIPTVLHESNAYPGMAIKFFDGKASKILLGFEDTKRFFKKTDNLEFVGNPTKVKNYNYSKEEKSKRKESLGLDPSMKTILVFGGSQGAKTINDNLSDYIIHKNITKEALDVQIVWATGKEQYDVYKEKFSKKGLDIGKIENVQVMPYIYNMEELLNIVDLAITRAGAMTITELAIVGLPSIFIPLPSRNANKQEENAKVFEDRNAGIIIRDSELNKDNLGEAIESLVKDDKLDRMSENALELKVANVLDKIYDIIQDVIKNKK